MNVWNGLLQPPQDRPGASMKRHQGGHRSRSLMLERRDEREAAGGPARFPKVENPWALTPTEVACLREIHGGKDHRTAAAALCMAHKTLSHHLSRAQDKMLMTNSARAAVELHRWLLEQGATA